MIRNETSNDKKWNLSPYVARKDPQISRTIQEPQQKVYFGHFKWLWYWNDLADNPVNFAWGWPLRMMAKEDTNALSHAYKSLFKLY